jgi:prefoldin subunit 5
MTIDERLDKLVERHEALAESVELLTRDVAELRASMAELRSSVAELRTSVAENTQHIRALSQIAAQTTETVRDLLRIAELHQRRLEKLEGE